MSISPLLQSKITGISAGIASMTVCKASIPEAPKLSKNAEFGLKAAAYEAVFCMTSRQKALAELESGLCSYNYEIYFKFGQH